MSAACIALISTSVFLLLTLCVSVYFNIKHGMLILKIEDALESSLDILDERYRSISKIVETPIFFDSTEVRQVISDINKSRDAVLRVANILTDVSESKGENKGENDGD